ncbi:phage holin family protein [Carnobacterium maltaromaticum]|uniref:phage holin family protein n=1 Tax=Carnobacterium maltaromaticum TaxID=2751 RepID=UPI00298AF802|nr:phage holin family protein [Carnobacterium maltaromaticum]MDW5524637.1 phage holin family protein [Carnobacterium maltaromaticum]
MLDILNMLKFQLTKMSQDGSWFVGAAGGLTIAIPEWIYNDKWSNYHSVLISILLGVLVFEWLVGGRLAKLSPVKRKTSEVAIDALVRDGAIIAICLGGYGFDYLLGTGSVIFAMFTVAFIYHNLYSLLANVTVLGWGKHFPIWLIKWLDNEIKAKTEKYFPNNDSPQK